MRLTTVFPRDNPVRVQPSPWALTPPAMDEPDMFGSDDSARRADPVDDADPAERTDPAQALSRAATQAATGATPGPAGPDHGPEPGPAHEAQSGSLAHRTLLMLDMIKFQHTIFGLPFALLGGALAAGGIPSAAQLFWIVAACIFARSAAMSFNRLHDEPFDRQNPRTQGWALPAGLLSRRFVGLFCVVCVVGFVLSAAMLNWLALRLAPVALLVLLGYSFAKRYSSFSHFFLGLALGMAPIGAWVAVRGELTGWAPYLLGLGVMLWTAGFDIIYSLQDVEVDRRLGLRSMPVWLGRRRALAISALCHLVALVAFASLQLFTPLGAFYLTAVALCAWLLWYEQSLVSPTDMTRLKTAFFTINGWVAVLVFAGGLTDILLAR